METFDMTVVETYSSSLFYRQEHPPLTRATFFRNPPANPSYLDLNINEQVSAASQVFSPYRYPLQLTLLINSRAFSGLFSTTWKITDEQRNEDPLEYVNTHRYNIEACPHQQVDSIVHRGDNIQRLSNHGRSNARIPE